MDGRDAPNGPYEEALTEAVHSALSAYPPGSATVHLRREATAGVWTITVEPVQVGAARVFASVIGGDEIMLGIGETHAYLWDDDAQALAGEVHGVVSAVFAGTFEERGPRGDSAVRVRRPGLGDWRGGSVLAMVTWHLRRRRRYVPLTG